MSYLFSVSPAKAGIHATYDIRVNKQSRDSNGAVTKQNMRICLVHGVYRFTRHPIYLGVIMVSIGVPVYVSSLYGLLTMSALIPLILNRIRMEERLLTDEFGDAYQTYKEAASKLIPFIY